MKKKEIYVLLLVVIVPAVFATTNYNAIYSEAYDLLQVGKTAEARVKFEIVLEAPEESGLLDNAEYWIANSYLDDRMFDKAQEHYRRAQNLPDGNKHAAAQFELAKAKAMAGDKIGAEMEYYKVLSLYPDADLSARALARIDSLGNPIEKIVGPATTKPSAAVGVGSPPKTVGAEPTPTPPPSTPEVQQPETEKHSTEPAKPGLTPDTDKPAPQDTEEKPQPKPEQIRPDEAETQTPKKVVEVKPKPDDQQKPAPGTEVTTPETQQQTSTEPTPKPSPAEIKPVETKPQSADSIGRKPDGITSVGYREKPEITEPVAGVGDSGDWTQPDPSEREDGITTLPLSGDPRQLIRPEDKRGF